MLRILNPRSSSSSGAATNTFKSAQAAGTPQGIHHTVYGDEGQHIIPYPKGTMPKKIKKRKQLISEFGNIAGTFETLTLASLKK